MLCDGVTFLFLFGKENDGFEMIYDKSSCAGTGIISFPSDTVEKINKFIKNVDICRKIC